MPAIQPMTDRVSPEVWVLIHRWIAELDPSKRMLIDELLRGGMIFLGDSSQAVKQCGCLVLNRAFHLLRRDNPVPSSESTLLKYIEITLLMRAYVGDVIDGKPGQWPLLPDFLNEDEDEPGEV